MLQVFFMLKYFFHKFGSGTILEPQTLLYTVSYYNQGQKCWTTPQV